ncbi:carbohydrate porin [Caulobacter sp. S45]|uniref:carbohydrate porin n=1 Tax=Caulobacter sp. S45 TaxID=1641861 RepID=UPI00157584B0|nr:carbohydrate porin [Caulobacter sp. S45]
MGAALALGAAGQAQASPPALSVPVSSEQAAGGAPQGFSGYLSSLQKSSFLLGDMFGLRTELSRFGASLAIQETSEVLGNATGGIHKGAEYDGLTQAIFQLNTQRAFGLYGGLFNVSALQIHGRNLSADNLGTIQTASGIEADRATRLWELWYDQKFLDEDRADIKVGLISADQEFIVSPNALYFVNTMFGWPALPSYDLPGGGPAYPLSAPAVRFRWRPVDPVNILVGVFNGAPSRTNDGDAQVINASGTQFPTNGGTLTFVELQYTYPALGAMVMPGAGAPLGHTYKIGAWYDSEAFDDERFDDHGVPLASPLSDGSPLRHRGQYSVYGVADQMLWRQQDDPNRSVSAFTRVMGSPQADRNFLSFSANVGLTYHDPVANRPDDTLAIGLGYAKVSHVVTDADRDAAAVARAVDPTIYGPARHDETFIEATYQYQLRPWWQVQPDFQYTFTPGGGVADPNQPTNRVKSEAVFGVRTNVLF